MNYIRLATDKIVDQVNNYVVNPVNHYVVIPVNDYVVTPVITTPINNFVVNPIHNFVRSKRDDNDNDDDTDIFVRERYTTFDSFKTEEASVLSNNSEIENSEPSYLEHLRARMYCSSLSLKASVYFFINGLFPNTLKEEGYNVLEYLKKTD